MDKEFGKLTLDEFRHVVKKLPEIRGEMKSFPDFVKAKKVKFDEILDHDFCWANLYQLTFLEQLGLFFVAIGRAKKLHEIALSEDPQQALIKWSEEDDLDDWAGGEGGQFEMKHVVAMVAALQRNILSIMLFHRSLNVLVEEARNGNEDSFFKAVRVDRSILACDPFADRLAKADLANDKTFFLHLKSALKGPSKKHWEALHDLRYSLAILKECGFINMSDAQLEDLLVHQLKLYPNVPSARKNLRKQLTESKKFSTT